MEIKFLGTGGAIDYAKGSSAALVSQAGKNLLIDCGPTIYPTLHKTGWLDKIDGCLLTHMHGDHTGGLFQLVVHYKHQLGRNLKIIYPTDELRADITTFLALMRYDTAVDFIPIETYPNVGFLDTFGQHKADMQTYAYYFTDDDELLYFSGDLGQVATTKEFLATRTENKITVFHDINKRATTGHTHYKDAMAELSDYNVYGYHCTKETMPVDNTIPLVEDQPEFLI